MEQLKNLTPKLIPVEQLKTGDFIMFNGEKAFVYGSRYVCITISNKSYNAYKVWGGWDYSDKPIEDLIMNRRRSWLKICREDKYALFEAYEPTDFMKKELKLLLSDTNALSQNRFSRPSPYERPLSRPAPHN